MALDRAELISIPLFVVTGSCPIEPDQASLSPGRRLGGCGGIRRGQEHAERRPAALPFFRPCPAAVQLGEPGDEGEAKAESDSGRSVTAPEGFEDAPGDVRRHAGSG